LGLTVATHRYRFGFSFSALVPKPVTDFKDQTIFNFAWSRDGKQLAISRGVVNSDVMLLQDFH